MDFAPSEAQAEFQASVRAFAERELNAPDRAPAAAEGLDREGWRKIAAFGLLGLPVPRAYGGLEEDAVTCCLAMEALGRGCRDGGLVFAVNSHVWTCEVPLALFGTADQKARYLTELCAGRMIGGHAMTEPGSGSDAFSLRTTAVRDGDGYVLNGTKTFVSNGPVADLLLVFASTAPARGFAGVSAFLVERGTPGFSTGRPLDKMGLRTSPTAEIALEDCRVPATARLGREGAGASIFNAEMDWERCCLFACHLGAMERQLDACVRYARERVQFGRPIGGFQAVAHRIADMKTRLELSRLILYKAAWLKDRGARMPVESAIAKLAVSESYVASSLDAIQIHGGYGYMTEFGVERDLRDAVAGRIYSGTSEIQRNIIAAWLGL